MAGSVQNGPKGPDVSRSGSGKAEKESENKGVQGAPGAQGTQGAKGTADEKGPGKAAGNPPDKATEKAMAERTGQSQLAAEAKAQIENNTAPAKEKTPAPASSPPETVDAKNPPDLSHDAINPSIGPMDVIGPGAALYGGGGSDNNGRGDGSYGGGMANGDPTPG